MEWLYLVFAFASGVAFMYYFFLRSSKKKFAFLLIWDGTQFRGFPVKEVASGVQASDGVIYPAGVLQALDSAFQFVQCKDIAIYFAAVEPVALANHRALEQARKTIALNKIFDGGGDMLRYLQISALIVPLIIVVMVYFSISGQAGTLARIEAQTIKANDVLSKPLSIGGK